MNIIRVIILTFLFAAFFPCAFAQQGHSKEEANALIIQLDTLIDHKDIFHKKREKESDAIEKELKTCPPDSYVDCCKRLYYSLVDYDGTRALSCLRYIKECEEYKNDIELQQWVIMSEAKIYCTMGFYHKAVLLLNSLDKSKLTDEERTHYYYTARAIYGNITEFLSSERDVTEEEVLLNNYLDSIISVQEDGIGRDLALADKYTNNNNPQKAIDILTKYLSTTTGKEYIYVCAAISEAYQKLGNTNEAIYYLTVTSINDIKNGTREYQAMPYLIKALYKEGDIDHAFSYLMCAMNDANDYPTRSLSVEVATYFPLVNQAFKVQQEEQIKSANLHSIVIGISSVVLLLILITVIILSYRYKQEKILKQKNEELRAALDKANIADKVKTEFIQNMRHEIRTPLNSIIGFSTLMSNDMSDAERENYKQIVQSNADNLLGIIDDIIDTSNMEVGSFNFKYKEHDIHEICNECIETAMQSKGENVKILLDLKEPIKNINTDASRVKQVLNNVLSNACKNTTEGIIILFVEHIDSDDTFHFVVTDTGIGVPPEKADIIFQHFQKLNRYSPGIGLGLYISRLIANALGGSIILDTTYTNGARFVFTIPNHKEQ